MISLPALKTFSQKGTTVSLPKAYKVQMLKMPWGNVGRMTVNQLTGLYHCNGICLGRELSIRVIDIKPIAVRMWAKGCYVFQPEDGDVFANIVESFESKADTNGVWGILYKIFHRKAGTTTLFTSPYTMYNDGPCHIEEQIRLTTERVKGSDWFRPVIFHKKCLTQV